MDLNIGTRLYCVCVIPENNKNVAEPTGEGKQKKLANGLSIAFPVRGISFSMAGFGSGSLYSSSCLVAQ